MKILKNHKDMHIRGVLSYVELSLGGQQIFVFGENHAHNVDNVKCPQDSLTFIDFLEQFDASIQARQLNVFVENPLCEDSIENIPKLAHIPVKFVDGNISELKRRYLSCMYSTTSAKASCSLQQTSIVPSDARNSKGTAAMLQEFKTITGPMLKVHQQLQTSQQPSSFPPSVYKFLQHPANFLYRMITTATSESSAEALLHPMYVQLVSKRLLDAEMVHRMLTMMQTYYDAQHKQHRHQLIHGLQPKVLFNVLCSFGSMLMDTFILFRLLLAHNKMEPCMILVGDYHAQLYKQLLTTIFGAQIVNEGTPVAQNSTCLRVS
jgi:hypothetical protein